MDVCSVDVRPVRMLLRRSYQLTHSLSPPIRLRDIPRFVELLDKRQFDAKSLATTIVPIEGMLDAYQQVIDRTTVTALMTA